jgi:hypothetical protein
MQPTRTGSGGDEVLLSLWIRNSQKGVSKRRNDITCCIGINVAKQKKTEQNDTETCIQTSSAATLTWNSGQEYCYRPMLDYGNCSY